jgi:hypothetical protein
MVPRLKISSISPWKNISSTYLISITSLPEDVQTSKHGGGGRYNANLVFKGSKIKKGKEKMNIYMYEKRKNMHEYVWYK